MKGERKLKEEDAKEEHTCVYWTGDSLLHQNKK
jgi:hypothetical protein